MTSRSTSDDLSKALESYTGAMTRLMTMPVRWSARGARGMARAFEEAVFCGPAKDCCDYCGCESCSCHHDCGGCNDDNWCCGCGDPHCGGCGDWGCEDWSCRDDSCCSCGDPHCGGCGHGHRHKHRTRCGCGDPHCGGCGRGHRRARCGCGDPHCDGCGYGYSARCGCGDPHCGGCGHKHRHRSRCGCGDPHCGGCGHKHRHWGHCGCGDPHCGGCGRWLKFREGAEIVTTAGFIGTIEEVGDVWVRVRFEEPPCYTVRIAKRNICRVLKRRVQRCDIVKTVCGFVGEVTRVEDHLVTINSGGTPFKVHRKSICKVLKEASPDDGGGNVEQQRGRGPGPSQHGIEQQSAD